MRGPRGCASGVPLPLEVSWPPVGELVSLGVGESGVGKALPGNVKAGGRFRAIRLRGRMFSPRT